MKRIITFLIIAIMTLNLIPAVALAESTPVPIINASDLAKLAEDPDGNFIIVRDIDASGYTHKAAGTASVPFSGTLDGDGHIISGINFKEDNYMGLFGYLTGTVKDLEIKDCTLEATDRQYIGGIAGYNAGTVENCIFGGEADVTDEKSHYAYIGGITGYNKGTVSGCTNSGTFNIGYSTLPTLRVGGISGYSSCAINKCSNSGEIYFYSITDSSYRSTTKNAINAGGIVGYISGNIRNCTNSGAVTVSRQGYEINNRCTVYAGGIAGQALGNILSCNNSGEVYGDAYYFHAYAGGIAGFSNGTVSNCNNTAKVTAYTHEAYLCAWASYAGGILGSNNGIIIGCGNSGEIHAKVSQWSTAYGGGIAGHNGTEISTCYNTGNVTCTAGVHYSGGVTGYNNTAIDNCYNTGNITNITAGGIDYTITDYTGGIAGAGTGKISTCYNLGSVTPDDNASTVYAGAIIGKNSADALEYCYYSDTLNLAGSGEGEDGGVSCTDSELQTKSTFEGFDFKDVWVIGDSDSSLYPVLVSNHKHDFGSVCGTVCYICYTVRNDLHFYDNSCDSDCNGCGWIRDKSEGLEHIWKTGFDDTCHYTVCANCGAYGTKDFHVFGEECNPYCFDCSYVSDADHVYEAATDDVGHFKECEYCGDIIDYAPHGYTDDCDSTCEGCTYVRNVSHNYVSASDESGHFDKCTVCDDIINRENHGYQLYSEESCHYIACTLCGYEYSRNHHSYDNDCDTDCNGCGYVRNVSHNYEPGFDNYTHFDKCTVCEDVINVNSHEFDNDCDTTCDCGYVRTITHDYQLTFDTENHFDECILCHQTKNVTAHKFDNDCDTDCNGCGYIRVTEHRFGEYIYNGDATYDEDGTKTRTCECCKKTETVTAEGTRKERPLVDSCALFKDVLKGKWYTPHIDFAVTYGIFSGTSKDTFSPDLYMTRAQFVQVFANLAGVDTSNSKVNSGFSDVPSGKWYTAAIAWAAENRIVSGVGDGKFNPDGKVTRQEMCIMLVNFVERYQKKTLDTVKPVKAFADNNKIASWAKDEVYKCAEVGLISGVGDNMFAPTSNATRAQGATLFAGFYKEYMK